MSDQHLIFSIDPGEHIGYAVACEAKVLEAGVITGTTERERFNLLQNKLEFFCPDIILIENSYKYKKKVSHMLKSFPEDQRPSIFLRDAKQVQFRLFGKPYGKYGKEKTLHRRQRDNMVQEYFGELFEVHANDALLLIVDWNHFTSL
ncbi:hypothetical protein [Ammoniphilus sp. YIM 78166]|uniref:hypothetical protein n=1 Tax=Ammoniphilus sp. YIM 78166 TaxID=1644106 RepID=UPI00106FD16E|nr:hypothetical protein [Ammoniphilus sp. YIM 78166]